MRKNLHPIVSFTAETEFSGKKEDFLSRDKNKADMIALISTALTKRGCHVIQSPGDADVDIVKATVERSRHCITTLVGDDTDLLILFLHYSQQTMRSSTSVLTQTSSQKNTECITLTC